VGLIARAIEEAGIPTVSMSSAYDITTLVKPPRTFFLNYPLGHTTGKPLDRENQMEILRSALGMSKNITEPGTIIELPFIWDDPFWLANEL
jgi:D-proline reductase (dithiol) PrdB